MGELKWIKKYHDIQPRLSFKAFIADIASIIKAGHTVYLVDRQKGNIHILNTIAFEYAIRLLTEMEKDESERKNISNDSSTYGDRFLCYYITEEEAENTQQAEEVTADN